MVTLPASLAALVAGATWEQATLGESGAQVYRLRSGTETCYLKVASRRPHSELHAEAEHLRWLQGRLPVPALRYTGADERQSYLLTAEVPGADASDEHWLTDPARLVALLAESLLLFHRQPVAGCPFDQRLDAELARAAANVAAGAVDADDFDEERAGRTPTSLLDELQATRPPTEDLVLIHGDYCFPNVVLKD